MEEITSETFPIEVAASIIADISTGIYRTPANALKELVSNAFDADATTVTISTGSPDFRTMTCTDDGCGMTAEEFRHVMGYIGGSSKRIESDTTDAGRPKIGRIGIGLLAVAQVCTKFRVFSSVAGSHRKFEADVNLEDFTRPEAARKHLGEEEIGQCSIVELAENERAHYTTIVMEEIRQGFRSSLRRSVAEETGVVREAGGVEEDRFRSFVEGTRDSQLLRTSEYRRLLWELSLVTPVPYLENGPFSDVNDFSFKLVELQAHDFKVICDGFELRKPILLPSDVGLTEPGTDFKAYILKHSAELEGRRLDLIGYLFHQRTQIRPSQLQGVLLRVRNVAIGSYDRSFLGFPGVSGPMASQITGEIYVESGLEEAMNIDRASFRESDTIYRELQRYLFGRLAGRDGVDAILPDIRRRSRERMLAVRQSRVHEQMQKRLTSFARKITRVTGHEIRAVLLLDTNIEPVRIDNDVTTVEVFEHHPVFSGSEAKRTYLMQFLVGYEVANALRPGDKELLLDILRQS
jgi:hypothetical protein